MIHINFNWEPPEIPDFDPEIHDPEKVFAFLCYRGVHYAKWVYLNIFPDDELGTKKSKKGGLNLLFFLLYLKL